jgi:hypothetical protein
MDHHLRCLVAELIAAKSTEELERMLAAIRACGDTALRAAAIMLPDAYLPLRVQRAAIALAVEVGGEEGTRLLRALLTATNVDDEERAAAVRGLGADTSSDTLVVLLELLAASRSARECECGRAVLAHLARVPADFDWAPVMASVPGSSLNDLRKALGEPAPPTLAALAAALDLERRTRRGPLPTARFGAVAAAQGTVHNPYLEALERQRNASPEEGADLPERTNPRSFYAYAVPTSAALRLAAEHAPLLEVGAGTGYWAWLLSQMHVDVVAYDREPPDGTYRNPYFEGGHTWTEVREGGPEIVHEHLGRTLFLCWPPPETPMAAQCLAAFQGDVVLYAGDWRATCGTPAFFDALEASFTQVAAVELPLGDTLRAFRRRGG